MKNEPLIYITSKGYSRGYMTIINNMMPKGAKHIIYQFTRLGFQTYLVGGCVRDIIMNRKPHDWDICTDATPTQIIDAVEYLNKKNDKTTIKIIPTGLQHGTLTLVIDGERFEVTTYGECKKIKERNEQNKKKIKQLEEEIYKLRQENRKLEI